MKTRTTVKIENKALRILFDKRSGAWVGLVHKASGMNLVAGGGMEAAFPLGSFRGEIGVSPALESYRVGGGGRKACFVLRLGGWRCRVDYALDMKQPILWRTFELENASNERQVVHGASFVLPWLDLGRDASVFFPGLAPVGETRISSLPHAKGIAEGDGTRPYNSKDSLTCLWSDKRAVGVGTWFYSESEFCTTKARRGAGATASACLNLEVIAPLQPGERASLGTQYVWMAGGSRDALISTVRDVYRKTGLHVPKDGLKDLRKSVIYCGHPGGTPEQKFIGYGGFKAVKNYLPTLRKMGVDILWLLPIFEHGKWNLYSPVDHFRISRLYGTEAELRDLAHAAKKLGIRLVFDFVPHGPPDSSKLAGQHPEWNCVTEDGKPEYEWSQLAFDNANPEWQKYFTRVAEHHARRFGVIGARIDVATGSKPNWRAPWRPSYSGLGGGLGMDRAIRRGFRRVNKRTIILPEEYTGSPLYYRDTDITYDSQLYFLFVALQEKKAGAAEWASSIARFLHDQSLALPNGAVKMRFTANHDVVSWTCQKKRPRDGFGPGRTRAMAALCFLIEGTPMIYQGEDDPAIYGGKGESNVDYIARLADARRQLPALTSGCSDYLGIKASNGVFACARGRGREAVLVLISFSFDEVTCIVKLPPKMLHDGGWKDVFSGDIFDGHGRLQVGMPPHAVRILVAV